MPPPADTGAALVASRSKCDVAPGVPLAGEVEAVDGEALHEGEEADRLGPLRKQAVEIVGRDDDDGVLAAHGDALRT